MPLALVLFTGSAAFALGFMAGAFIGVAITLGANV